MSKILSISDSNKYIINLLHKNEPFIISRLGGKASIAGILYDKNETIPKNIIDGISMNAGIYCNNIYDVKLYCQIHNNAIKNSVALASFPRLCVNQTIYYNNKYNMDLLHNRCLESFYTILENEIPWTHYLKNKKVLIINPFVESFKKQLRNNFKMFKDKDIFLPDQEFVFYKAFNTLANNKIHSNWYETYNIMCDEISKLDFDIALLGCGGYGLPLCNFINEKLSKSSIYIGGGLQLLFGVIGRRWDNNLIIQKIIKENNCKFIRPDHNETVNNKDYVEGGCYW